MALSERLSYEAQAVVFPHGKYKSAVAAAPDGWGTDDGQKHNALFMLRGISPKKALGELPAPKTDIETVTSGPGVIFWSISKKHQTKATLMKLPQELVYQQMTVRNHNTVFKLLQLFEDV